MCYLHIYCAKLQKMQTPDKSFVPVLLAQENVSDLNVNIKLSHRTENLALMYNVGLQTIPQNIFVKRSNVEVCL